MDSIWSVSIHGATHRIDEQGVDSVPPALYLHVCLESRASCIGGLSVVEAF